MQIDAVIKVISHFRENAQDILKLIQNSQTAHAESGLVTKVLMYPFTQFKTLFQSMKVLKGTAAMQGIVLSALAYIGYSYKEMPYWVYGVLFLVWYLLSLLQGLYLMQKMDKNNPFFFYKLFKVMHPSLYKAFEELAKNSESFSKLYDDLQNSKLSISLLSQQELIDFVSSIDASHKQSIRNYQKIQEDTEKSFKKVINKVTKVTYGCINEQVSFEDLNLAFTPILVYRETDKKVILAHDTTSLDIANSYNKENFFKEYKFIEETDAFDVILVGEKENFEYYTYILRVNGQRWFITYLNDDKNNLITAEIILGDIIPKERIINILKKVIELTTK